MSHQQKQDELDATHGRRVSSTPSPPLTSDVDLNGRYVTLSGLQKVDIQPLWQNLGLPENQALFAYLPFPARVTNSQEAFWDVLESLWNDRGFVLFAIKVDLAHLNSRSADGVSRRHTESVGIIAYLDIQPSNRAAEIGCVIFGPALQRTIAATEAHYLMLRHAFDDVASHETRDHTKLQPGYRRLVWKCNSLNQASRRAAERLGFKYEGTLRNHMIAKGRSRDSDFLSILDDEWLDVKTGFEMWLADDNFDENGKQKTRLEECRRRNDV